MLAGRCEIAGLTPSELETPCGLPTSDPERSGTTLPRHGHPTI